MAEAFFNQMAKGKATAVSAGTRPAVHTNKGVIKAMREIGIDVSNQKPKALIHLLFLKIHQEPFPNQFLH